MNESDKIARSPMNPELQVRMFNAYGSPYKHQHDAYFELGRFNDSGEDFANLHLNAIRAFQLHDPNYRWGVKHDDKWWLLPGVTQFVHVVDTVFNGLKTQINAWDEGFSESASIETDIAYGVDWAFDTFGTIEITIAGRWMFYMWSDVPEFEDGEIANSVTFFTADDEVTISFTSGWVQELEIDAADAMSPPNKLIQHNPLIGVREEVEVLADPYAPGPTSRSAVMSWIPLTGFAYGYFSTDAAGTAVIVPRYKLNRVGIGGAYSATEAPMNLRLLLVKLD